MAPSGYSFILLEFCLKENSHHIKNLFLVLKITLNSKEGSWNDFYVIAKSDDDDGLLDENPRLLYWRIFFGSCPNFHFCELWAPMKNNLWGG